LPRTAHRGHDGLGHARESQVQPGGQVGARVDGLGILGHQRAELRRVGTRTERLARPRQHDGMDLGIALGLPQRIHQRLRQRRIQRVVLLRPVHRQDADGPLVLNQEFGHAHARGFQYS